MASIAANIRSTCGSERRAPEYSTQRFPAAAPQVGQGTETNCLGVSSFLFIRAECDNTLPRNRSILNTFSICSYWHGFPPESAGCKRRGSGVLTMAIQETNSCHTGQGTEVGLGSGASRGLWGTGGG